MPREASFSKQQLLYIINLQTQIIQLGTDVNAIMHLLVNHAGYLKNSTAMAITLIEQQQVVCHAASQNLRYCKGKIFNLNDGLSGIAISTRQRTYSADYQQDPRIHPELRALTPYASLAVLPLFFNDMPIGTYLIFSDQHNAFSDLELQLLDLLSATIATALHHSIKVNQQIQMATQDYLTGIQTRAALVECFEHMLQLQQQRATILIIDMNDLKTINDQYGHQAGDLALIEVAQRLKHHIRKEDLIVRLGGDEFAIFLSNVDQLNLIQHTIDRLMSSCANGFIYKQQQIDIHISIGYACYPQDGQHLSTLMECADLRMYQHKRQAKIHKA
jgi:diguanylate cyclase (GGDEF)-like protein